MGLLDLFRSRPRQDEPREEWWERLDRIEHEMEQLQLAWEETYGKVRRALAALAKRQQRGEPDEPEDKTSEQADGNGAAPNAALYAKLRTMYPRR